MVDCDGNNPPWISAAAGKCKWHTQPNTDSWREGRRIRIKRIITIFFLKSVTLVFVVIVVVVIFCKTVLIIIAIGDYHNLYNRLWIHDDHHCDEGATMHCNGKINKLRSN